MNPDDLEMDEERRREISEEIADEERHEREVEWSEGPLWI
jgi:hypothetical protein